MVIDKRCSFRLVKISLWVLYDDVGVGSVCGAVIVHTCYVTKFYLLDFFYLAFYLHLSHI